MKEEEITKLALFYKIFGDETRLKILFLLKERSYHVNALKEALGISQSAVSHHLQLLKQLSLVEGIRDKTTVYYRLKDHHINEILEDGVNHIKEGEDD